MEVLVEQHVNTQKFVRVLSRLHFERGQGDDLRDLLLDQGVEMPRPDRARRQGGDDSLQGQSDQPERVQLLVHLLQDVLELLLA